MRAEVIHQASYLFREGEGIEWEDSNWLKRAGEESVGRERQRES